MMSHEDEDIDRLIEKELVDYSTPKESDDLDHGAASYHGTLSDYEAAAKATIPISDATVNSLRKHFIHCGSSCPMKRAPSGSAFTHCPVSLPIAKEYKKLRALLGQHARLQLQKDVNSRILQFEIFVRNLKKLVQEETASWQAINISKDAELEDHQTNLTALSSICDEFRMHLNHWICIKHKVQNNRWLRDKLPSLLIEMHQICSYFVTLQETAFWWTEKLLKTGMQVFAYVDRRSLTYNDVFSIVRGIEEYNTLILLVRLNTQDMRLSSHSLHVPEGRNCLSLVQHSHLGSIDSSTTKSLHFLRLLHSLAFEWAKSAVAITTHFLDNQSLLINVMQSKSSLHVDKPPASCSRSSPTGADSLTRPGSPVFGNTSDYFSESLNHKTGDPGAVPVDITSNASPLLDFGKKEKEYISKVIQITCQRTTLLRKNKYTGSSAQTSGPMKNSHSKGDEAVISEDPSSEAFIRQDIKRKSVSWGDSHDMTVCRQLIAKYNDALWKAFGARLEDSLNYELNWSKPGGHKPNIGCLDLCSSGALQTFIASGGHASSKGYFTNYGSQQFSQVLSLLKARALLTSCDTAISKCLSSMQIGKVDAIPLHNGRKSTRTAMLLRNAVILVKPQLEGCPHAQPLSIVKGSPSHHQFLDYRIRFNAVSRLEIIISLAEKWCLDKAKQFLYSYKVAPFVIITHGDLVILHKELLSALQLIKSELFVEQVKAMQEQLDRLALFHVQMKEKLSEKAQNLTLEILNQQMPRPRAWRSSNDRGGDSLEIQEYAENLVDSVLMPVADGAKHLCADDQVAAINTVVSTICQTWSDYFLKHKTRFSAHGAVQLHTDFGYLRNFVDVYLTDDSVKSRILQSRSIHNFDAIISLLREQSSSSSGSVNRSIVSRNNRVFPMEELNDESQPDKVTYRLENASQWQALKVANGKTVFPCMSTFC